MRTLRRLARHRSGMAGVAMLAVVVAVAILAPVLAPHDPMAQRLDNTMAPPSSQHWLGTDELGRDVASRLVYGSRVAVVVGVSSVAIAVAVGLALGAAAGMLGGVWDTVVMRVADAFFAFPVLVGAMVLIVVLGRGVGVVVVAIAVFSWAVFARLVRGSILTVREAGYVQAARAAGASRWRVARAHVLPNAIAPVVSLAAMSVGLAIVAQASLSFVGLGVPPGVPEWGAMIAEGRRYFGYRDHLWVFGSVAVVWTVLGCVLAGDGLRDALDPRSR